MFSITADQLTPFIAFLAGFTSFFASCFLPLVPAYLGFLSGMGVHGKQNERSRWTVLPTAVLFVLGFSVAFVFLGAVLQRFALSLGAYRQTLSQASGLLFLILGAAVLGLGKGKTSFLQREWSWSLPLWMQQYRYPFAFLTGISFALGWTPCIGPLLALILFWATQAASVGKGVWLLSLFSLGLGTPFLIVALFYEWLAPRWKSPLQVGHWLRRLLGGYLLLTGILLLLGQFQAVILPLLRVLQLPVFTM